MTTPAPGCTFAMIGPIFVLRWHAVPDEPSVRLAREEIASAWTAGGQQPLGLLLIIASTSGIPDGAARSALKELTNEARKVASHCCTVIEAKGALAAIIKSAIGVIGAATRTESDWMQFGDSAEEGIATLAQRMKVQGAGLVSEARKKKLIA